MKKCQYCAEEIQDEAIICRFCGKDLRIDIKSKPQTVIIERSQKKSNLIIWLLLSIIVVCIIGTLLVTDRNRGGSIGFYDVEYVISGTAKSISVTYFNDQGGMEQINSRIPFSKVYKMKLGGLTSLVAQNQGSTGNITCEIKLNGKNWKTSTTTASYGVVTCSGMIGTD